MSSRVGRGDGGPSCGYRTVSIFGTHIRGTALGVPCFHERVSFPHRMVRRILGNTDTRGICDPDSSQPTEEPAQSAAADQRIGHCHGRDCVAVHAVGDIAAVHTTAFVVVGGNCVACGDLSLCGAGSENLVLSAARAALMRPFEQAREPRLLPIVRTHATVPNSHPTPEVIAMASAPQKVRRIAPVITLAPPACAASPPRSARNNSEVPATRGISNASGATAVTRRGRKAPMAKLPADAHAA